MRVIRKPIVGYMLGIDCPAKCHGVCGHICTCVWDCTCIYRTITIS